METPSSYMYADLRSFGKLTNKQVAQNLLTDSTKYGQASPRDRINERTFLSRQVVHVLPSQVHPEFFSDFSQSAQTITGKMVSNLADANAYEKIALHFGGEAAMRMASLLKNYSLDGTLYLNAVRRIDAEALSSIDKATLLVMMFLATGSLANPAAAVQKVHSFIEDKLAKSFSTIQPSAENMPWAFPADQMNPPKLGLIRIDGGIVRSSLYPLASDKEGTTIGLLCNGGHGINDVGIDVSRAHLRIFRKNNAWFAQDLNSTNGTTLISGEDKSVTPIGGKAEANTPAKIEHGDILCLGSTTRFLVMQTA